MRLVFCDNSLLLRLFRCFKVKIKFFLFAFLNRDFQLQTFLLITVNLMKISVQTTLHRHPSIHAQRSSVDIGCFV
jgi:hypothetical protein